MGCVSAVAVCLEHNRRARKLVVLPHPRDWDSFLDACARKLACAALRNRDRNRVRVLTGAGREISPREWVEPPPWVTEYLATRDAVLVLAVSKAGKGKAAEQDTDRGGDGPDSRGLPATASAAAASFSAAAASFSADDDGTACAVSVVASASEVEPTAVEQLRAASRLPGMRFAVGMPDLHPGRDFPIGAACAAAGFVYPALVGTDIGCGMSLLQLPLKARKALASERVLDRWCAALQGLERPWAGDTVAFLAGRGVAPAPAHAAALGTIGGGNHFAELQVVERVRNRDLFGLLALDEDRVFLCVHSGSRALGEEVFREFCGAHGGHHVGVPAGSPEALEYLRRHDHAVAWARANRALIARRITDLLCCEPDREVLDVCHNSVTRVAARASAAAAAVEEEDDLMLHRKGAAPAAPGCPIVIPGSRGAFSYLVMPTGSPAGLAACGFSLAHGAGRRWTRSKALEVGRRTDKRGNSYMTTALGSRVICEDKDLLFEEAPDAYKEIGAVVADLEAAGAIDVIAELHPVITYKVRVVRHSK